MLLVGDLYNDQVNGTSKLDLNRVSVSGVASNIYPMLHYSTNPSQKKAADK